MGSVGGVGRVGRWGDGEIGRWGDGEMGRWGDGENFRQIVGIFAPIYRNIPSYPNHELLVIVLMQSLMGETTAVAHGGDPQDRAASPRPRCIA